MVQAKVKEEALKAAAQVDSHKPSEPADAKKAAADSDDEEEIDEETQMRLAQAVAQNMDYEDLRDENEEDEEENEEVNGDDDDGEEAALLESRKARLAKQLREEPAVLTRSPNSKGKTSTARAKSIAALGSTAASPAQPHSSTMASQGQPHPHPSGSLGVPDHHLGWSKIKTTEELGLKNPATCSLFDPPKSLKDSRKWKAEVGKLAPVMQDLDSVLSCSMQTSTVQNQQIKSHLTTLKRINDKTDKKIGYEKGTKDNPTLSTRCTAIRAILEAARDLRSLCWVT